MTVLSAVTERVVAEDGFELGEVLARELRALAELRHVGAQVVDPDFLGVALVRFAAGEEQHIGLHALRIEDAGRQAQDGVQVALVHQVAADLLADIAFEQHVVGQHHGGATTGLQAAIDVLQEAELLVAGGIGEIIAGGQAAAFLGAEGRIGQDQRGFGQRLRLRGRACRRSGCRPIDAVQHQVHQRQAVRVLHVLHAVEGVAAVLALLRFGPARRSRCARAGSGWRRSESRRCRPPGPG